MFKSNIYTAISNIVIIITLVLLLHLMNNNLYKVGTAKPEIPDPKIARVDTGYVSVREETCSSETSNCH